MAAITIDEAEAMANLADAIESRIDLVLTPAALAQLADRGISEAEARAFLRVKAARAIVADRETRA